jgi:hypothetical protein
VKTPTALAILLLLSAPALAGLTPGSPPTPAGDDPPVTSFTPNGNSFIASVYPSTPAGAYTNDTGPIALPLPTGFSVPVGFEVLLDPNHPTDDADQADWMAVLEFVPTTPGGTASTSIELLSPGAAFPGVSTVLAGVGNNTTHFDVEATPAGPGVFLAATYFAGPSEYDIYQVQSAAPAVVPEPATAGLTALAAGALAAAVLRRRHAPQR